MWEKIESLKYKYLLRWSVGKEYVVILWERSIFTREQYALWTHRYIYIYISFKLNDVYVLATQYEVYLTIWGPYICTHIYTDMCIDELIFLESCFVSFFFTFRINSCFVRRLESFYETVWKKSGNPFYNAYDVD